MQHVNANTEGKTSSCTACQRKHSGQKVLLYTVSIAVHLVFKDCVSPGVSGRTSSSLHCAAWPSSACSGMPSRLLGHVCRRHALELGAARAEQTAAWLRTRAFMPPAERVEWSEFVRSPPTQRACAGRIA